MTGDQEGEDPQQAGSDNPPQPETLDRKVLLSNSIGVLKKLESRITGRFRVREGDREYLQFIRAYASLLTAINSIYRDSELDKMREELDQVIEEQGGQNDSFQAGHSSRPKENP